MGDDRMARKAKAFRAIRRVTIGVLPSAHLKNDRVAAGGVGLLAKLFYVLDRDRAAIVAPATADIGQNVGDFPVAQLFAEGRHAVGIRNAVAYDTG